MKKTLLILLLLPSLVFSQGVINNGAKLIIGTGAIVYIDGNTNGDYKNQTNGANLGTIDLDGTLVLEGDWTNNSANNVFVGATNTNGLVEFRGTTAQDIKGSGLKTIFEDVTINNASGIRLNDPLNAGAGAIDAEIASNLTFTAGVVTTGSNKLIMTSTTAADLLAFSNASFVNGNFRRFFAVNASTYSFPVGDGSATTNYKRVDLVNSSLNLASVSDYLDISVAAVTEGGTQTDATFAAASKTCVGTPLKLIHSGAEWTIVPSNATVSSGTYGVRLYVENVGDGLSGTLDNKFTVVKRATTSITYADYDAVVCAKGTSIPADGAAGRIWNAGAGYAEKTTLSTFSKFAIASGNNPLPITLTQFNASCNGSEFKIKWTTASEINNDYFIIEKSYDGVNYFELEQVNGAGNSNSINNYSITDNDNSTNTTLFYRLTQVDYDGATETFNSVSIQNCSQHNGVDNPTTILLYPNPAIPNSEIAVQLNGFSPNAKIQLDMRDILGKKLFSKQVIANSDGSVFSSLSNSKRWASGTYIVTTTSNNLVSNQKLLIK